MRVTICQIDELRVFTGNSLGVEHDAPAPKGWVFADPPHPSNDEIAHWSGSDWVICNTLPEPAILVPERITTLQAELQLIEDGLLQAVNDTISALPEPKRSVANAKWHKSRYIYRSDPLVDELLVAGVGRASEQVDAMFVSASTL